MNRLLQFYRGTHPDHRGRLWSEILQQGDRWLEVTHDYIQWLFPNREPSGVNPGAPTITDEMQAEFLRDELVRKHLLMSFQRMLAFYGLEMTGDGIRKSQRWSDRKANWFTQDTHNNLRITRILKCLKALGLETEAVAFHAALLDLRDAEADCGIGEAAFHYWNDAVTN